MSKRPLLEQIHWMLDRSSDGETLRRAFTYLSEHEGILPPAAAALAAGALLHARAVALGEHAPLLAALGQAERAVEHAPRSPAAQFNRALVLADLGLCRQARLAFEATLAVETDPSWIEEIRLRQARLPCRPGAAGVEGPDADFRAAVEEELGSWGRQAADPLAARASLTVIARLGERLASTGEPFVARLAAELREREGDAKYAAAVADLVAAREAFAKERYELAGGLLARATPVLERRGSLLVPWGRIWLAGLAMRRGDWAEVEELLARTAGASRSAAGPRVEGQRQWALGLARLRQGMLGPALEHFTAAETQFEQGRYREASASIRTLKAETLARLGLTRESWEPRLRAMRDLQRPRPLFTLHNALVEGATAAERIGAHEVADALIGEARLLAEETGDLNRRVETMLFTAEVWQERGERARAGAVFRQAQQEANRIGEAAVALPLGNRAALGAWRNAETAPAAAQALVAVVRYYAAQGPAWREIEAERALAQWHLGQGDPAAAERELARAAAVAARERRARRDNETILEQARELLAERVRLAIATQAPQRALELLETDGGAGFAAGRSTVPIDPFATRGRPEVVVVLLPVEEHIAWWRLADGGLEAGLEPSTWRPERRGGRELATEELEQAYRAILAKPLASIGLERTLALVVAGSLRGVPFAALRNPRTGAHLIEERAVRFHPSVGEALRMIEQTPNFEPRHSWRAVTVGAPKLDAGFLPFLEPLPHAEEEAQRVAGLYGSGSLALTGADATARAVRAALAGAQVLHLATHGVAGQGEAARALALAAEPGDEGGGLTSTADLLGGDGGLQLVVLSACSSLGDNSGTSSSLGLAQSFVEQGVPATIGTLWPLKDDLLAWLALTFHRRLIAGDSASEALRGAQREAILLAGEESCCAWAGLQLFGDLPANSSSH